MAAVKGKDTTPEMVVRRLVHGLAQPEFGDKSVFQESIQRRTMGATESALCLGASKPAAGFTEDF